MGQEQRQQGAGETGQGHHRERRHRVAGTVAVNAGFEGDVVIERVRSLDDATEGRSLRLSDPASPSGLLVSELSGFRTSWGALPRSGPDQRDCIHG